MPTPDDRATRRATGQALAGIFIAVMFVLAVAAVCGVLPALLIANIR